MTNNPINPIPETHRLIAKKGGQSRSLKKTNGCRANLAKAREMKRLYRLDPSLRGEKVFKKEEDFYGHQG